MREPLTKPCSTEFQAAHSSGRRYHSDVHLIVLHDEEGGTARGAAEYFTHMTSGGSAHLCVDDNECYATLSPVLIPWGAASAPQISANKHGFHIEQAGYARWSAAIWKSHIWTLRRAAYKTALWATHYNIPLVFVDADGLIAGRKGITTHNEVSKASRRLDPGNADRYTHSDPGPLWPRLFFMALVRYYAKGLR